MSIETMKDEMEEMQNRLTTLQDGDNEEEYDDMLNDVYGGKHGLIDVGGIRFTPAFILHELDPVAYSLGLDNFNDAEIADLEAKIEALGEDITSEERADQEAKTN